MFDRLYELEDRLDHVQVRVTETEVGLRFDYLPEAVSTVKAYEGSKYEPYDKSWSVPLSEQNADEVEDLIHALEKCFVKAAKQAELDQAHRMDISEQVAAELQRDFPQLRWDYQDEYVSVGFPYHAKAVKAIKKVPGKVWESDEKLWLLPADEERAIRKAARVIVKCL